MFVLQQQGQRNGRDHYLLIWAANPATGTQGVIGPATTFRAVGPSLRAGPQGQEVAHFRDGVWRRRKIGGEFSLLWTEEWTTLHFVDPHAGTSMALDPIEMVGIVGNTIYVDVEYSQPVASLDPATGRWRSNSDGTIWPEVVFAPAPRQVIVNGGLTTRSAMNSQ